MKSNIKPIKYIYWILSFEIISSFIGMISSGNRNWYQSLAKSSLTPPGFVFGIVWPILYLLLAIVACILWENRAKHGKLIQIFAIQMIFNWLWSPVFFGYQMIGASLAILAIMVLLNSFILFKAYFLCRKIFYIMLPYFLWINFATYLNSVLFALNYV